MVEYDVGGSRGREPERETHHDHTKRERCEEQKIAVFLDVLLQHAKLTAPAVDDHGYLLVSVINDCFPLEVGWRWNVTPAAHHPSVGQR